MRGALISLRTPPKDLPPSDRTYAVANAVAGGQPGSPLLFSSMAKTSSALGGMKRGTDCDAS